MSETELLDTVGLGTSFDRPRMPNTPERARLEKRRSIREVVFGAQDGVLTTLGIVTGVGAAHTERATLLLTGILSMLVGAVSMGVGEYLGGKTEREVVQNAIALESREMLEKPDEEFAEQVAYYRVKGFTAEEAHMIVSRLAKNRDVWLHEMMRDEFGIDPRIADASGLMPAFSMAGSFALGAFVPILPHLLPVSAAQAIIASFVLAAAVLFCIGIVAGRLGGRMPLRKGFEIVAFGAVVFLISFIAGHYVPLLFGHASVSAE